MAIKKFNTPEPDPKQTPAKNSNPARESMFSAWQNGNLRDPKTAGFGQKLYAEGGVPEGRYQNNEELIEAVLGTIEGTFDKIEKLIKLYIVAMTTRTRASVQAYGDALKEIVGDNDEAGTTIGILIGVLVNSGAAGQARFR